MSETKMFIVGFAFIFAIIKLVSSHCQAFDDIWSARDELKKCCKSIFDYDVKELNVAPFAECRKINDDECEVIKCAFKKMDVLADGKINATLLTERLISGKSNTEWKFVISAAVLKCKDSMVGKKHPVDYFGDCLAISSFTNCPKADWLNDPMCIDKKTTLTSCL